MSTDRDQHDVRGHLPYHEYEHPADHEHDAHLSRRPRTDPQSTVPVEPLSAEAEAALRRIAATSRPSPRDLDYLPEINFLDGPDWGLDQRAFAAFVLSILDAARASQPITATTLSSAMNDAYTYEDRDNSVPALPFIDDGEAFWDPFAAKVLAALPVREGEPTGIDVERLATATHIIRNHAALDMSADPRTDRRLRDANGDLVSLGTVRTDPPTPDPLYGPAATARVHAKLDKAHCFVTNCRLPQHLAVERRSGNDRRAALPSAPDQRLLTAVEAAILNIQHNRIGAAIAGLRVARDLSRAALSEATTSPEATLDVEAAYNTLRRAGIGERQARDITVDMLAAALTGERHDEDDDRLTPEKRSRVRALAARLRGPA